MTSQLNVDTIVDKTGSGGTNVKMANTSTYVSDGGSSTQNTVQGLGKSWWCLTGGNATISDSFNTSSAADVSTGRWTTTRTNNMNSTHYSASGACGRAGFSYVGGDLEMPITFPTTSLIEFHTYNYDASVGDVQYISGQIDGDLA